MQIIKPILLWLSAGRAKIADFSRRNPRLAPALKIAIIFSLFFIFAFRTLDPDFGWHLQAGGYIRHHWIPSHDLYTYTAPRFPWIDHEWGNDVLVSLLYSAGGYFTLSILYSAVWTAALVIGGGLKTRLSIFLLAVGALLPYSGIRPVAWTALILAVLLRMITSKSKRVRYAIPLLFLLWANLHAGFIIGLAILGLFMLKERKKTWLYILIASFLLTFVNPYGPRLYVEIFRTLSDSRLHSQINEWYPVHMPVLSWIFAVLWASAFGIFYGKKLTNWINVSSLLLLATLSANRNVPLFVVASIKDLAGNYEQALKRLPRGLDVSRKLVIALFLVTVLTVASYGVRNIYNSVSVANREQSYPVQAVAYLKDHPCDGNLFNDYDYGGYLIWKLPGRRVFIDGRMPSWRDVGNHKYLDTYFSIVRNSSQQKKQFKKYNIQCALLGYKGQNIGIIKRLQDAKWKTAVQENGSYLLLAPGK